MHMLEGWLQVVIVVCNNVAFQVCACVLYISNQISMSELNKLVSDILTNNEHDTKNAIQQLLHLLTTQPPQHHELIRKAILFSMENLHEWANIMKYTEKWKMTSFRKGFISRMRKRVNEEGVESEENDSVQEVKRLVEKYWKTRSPKKEENVYKEPITLNNIIRNTTNQPPIPPKADTVEAQLPPKIEQKQPDPQPNQQQSTKSNPISNPKEQSANERRERDPLAAVTGRPTILKKKSILQVQSKPVPAQSSNEQKKSIQANNSKTAPNSRILNIMKRYADKEQVIKTTESWDNFDSDPPKKDQDFPTDKFKFGSNKKSNEPEILKKMTLSPRKYDPTTKIVKILRPQAEPKNNLHQFSFASSERKEERQDNPQEQIPKPLPQPEKEFQADNFVFQDLKESQETSQIKDHNSSNQKVASPTETPMFTFNQSKRRKSSVSRRQSLQVNEQLKVYDPNIKVRYFMREIEVRLKIDTMSLFQEQWGSFIKDPQAYVVDGPLYI